MSIEKDIFEDNTGKKASMLNSIPKDNPFKVPEGYFDALPAQVLEKCRKSSKHVPVLITNKVFWLFRPQWIITTFIAVAGLCFFIQHSANNAPINYNTIAAAIPDSVIMQNLQNNIDDINMSSLEDMAQGTLTANAALPGVEDTSNSRIINYLMNNNIDASDIENEL